MIKYAILITIFFSIPLWENGPQYAVKVNSLHGKPLVFDKIQDCYDHVNENVEPLKQFAISVYKDQDPNVLVKTIMCVQVPGEDT